MDIILNKRQTEVLNKAVDWFFNSSEQVFQFSGGPGTGKSVVLHAIIDKISKKCNIDIAPMAYTGNASIVMRMKGFINAKTIHSSLYTVDEKPLYDNYGNIVMDPYFNVPVTKISFIPNTAELMHKDIIVIDEASMVPMEMKQDILNTGKKVLVCGDINQLGPVDGNSAFLTTGRVEVLTDIMRQAENSAIVYLSQRALRGLPIHCGIYGDCIVIQQHELTDRMLYYANTILCCKNSTRENLNHYFRSHILGYNSKLPNIGEKLICKRNNWTIESGGINLTNGMTGLVINQPDVRSFNNKLFLIDFNPLLTNIPFEKVTVDYEYFISDINKKKTIKSFRRPKEANQFDFGYAQTVHSAQGSQWSTGVYIQEYMKDMNRINYTAISRFMNSCIIVLPDMKNYKGGINKWQN